MPIMQQCPPDSPLMKAWTAYQETEDFRNSFNWATRLHGYENGPNGDRTRATDVQRGEWIKGALWAAFMAGFNAAVEPGRNDGIERVAQMLDQYAEPASHLFEHHNLLKNLAQAARMFKRGDDVE